ncbi:hypothetical protein [Streptomyces sp. NRRL WC-3742]|uniref:hypothetical protein n=1 Tax=Streptomyces sp. NRRL WC-3742 TaxID=1463934 RepID=UPI0004CC8743|nr:hypothetical protein [Streptomyces sp. NRRL WC-3742]
MPKGFAQMGPGLYATRARDRRLGPAPAGSGDLGLLRRGSVPCLLAVLRLAAHQEAYEGAGMGLAAELVRAGHLGRAVELVRAGAGRSGPEGDLVRLVRMAGEAGDLDGAGALAESLSDRSQRDRALVARIPAVARAGERERAAGLVEALRYPHSRPQAWAGLAKEVADSGDFPAALGYAVRAAEYAYGAELGHVLVMSMEIAHAAGDHVLAGTFADRAEDLVRREGSRSLGHRAFFAALLAFEARSGDLDRFDVVLCSLARAAAAAAAAAAAEAAEAAELAAAGVQEGEADSDGLYLTILARPRPRPPFEVGIVSDLLEAVAETADREVALVLAARVEELLGCDAGFDGSALWEAVALLLARHGRPERALALADQIVEPDLRAARKAEVIEALAWSGYTDQAEALARALTDRWARSRALMAVIGALAQRGETARAEALVPAIPDRWGRGEAVIDVVCALARQGEPQRAEALAHTILLGGTRARALAALAALVDASDPATARRLAARAVFLGGWAVLYDLEEIAPGGALAVADEVMTWWDAHPPTTDGTKRRGRPRARRP